MFHPLLDINLVNFNDPYEIGGFMSLLCQIGDNMGMAMSDFKPTRESYELRQIANKLVRKLYEIQPKWIYLSLDRWCNNFIYGKSQTPLSDYDTIQQVTILLRSNLFFKLFDNHRHFLNKLDDLNCKILLALYQLLLASLKYLSSDEFLSYKEKLIQFDRTSTSLNRFYREAMVQSIQ